MRMYFIAAIHFLTDQRRDLEVRAVDHPMQRLGQEPSKKRKNRLY